MTGKAVLAVNLVLAVVLLFPVRLTAQQVELGDIEIKSSTGVLKSIPAGEEVFLRVAVKSEPASLPLEYRWNVAAGELKSNTNEPTGFYRAPQNPGNTTVTIVALLKGTEIKRKTFKLLITLPVVRERASTAAKQGSSSPASNDNPITITRPSRGDTVQNVITVLGNARKLTQNERIIVLAQAVLPDQRWWVQSLAVLRADGSWSSSPVYIGLPDDHNLAFRLCAVITTSDLQRGQTLTELPSGQNFCTEIRR
jgi:hypothetical protein